MCTPRHICTAHATATAALPPDSAALQLPALLCHAKDRLRQLHAVRIPKKGTWGKSCTCAAAQKKFDQTNAVTHDIEVGHVSDRLHCTAPKQWSTYISYARTDCKLARSNKDNAEARQPPKQLLKIYCEAAFHMVGSSWYGIDGV